MSGSVWNVPTGLPYPYSRPPKIERFDPPADSRILAVSDVHGNLRYLRGLLDSVRFSPGDVLVLVGDLLEKGPQSLDTLRYVMDLSRTHRVRYVAGNCDWIVPILFESGRTEDSFRYLQMGPRGLLREMLGALGIPVTPDMDFPAAREAVKTAFAPEFAFLAAAPEILVSEHLIFVHGGLPVGAPETWQAWKCLKYDNYLASAQPRGKWQIVGHWPVMLYRENVVDANPVVDRAQRVVSIDGGCVLKDDGQLNALILPREDSEDFSFAAWDPFPTATVLTPQAASARSYYIRWGDNAVEVLDRGAEFSRVRHRRTGYEMDVLTKYLYSDGTVNDCTDYRLPLRPGDEVKIVETTSRGYFVKHNGVSGWYFGELIVNSCGIAEDDTFTNH